MRITTQADYGLSCILNLARKFGKGPVTISRIAVEEKLSEDYLEQLLGKLRRARIVKTVRGPGGGYLLARRPNEITVKEVIEALEMQVFEIICHRGKRKKYCVHISECGVRPVWIKLKENIEDVLQNINIELLLKKEDRIKTKFNLNGYR